LLGGAIAIVTGDADIGLGKGAIFTNTNLGIGGSDFAATLEMRSQDGSHIQGNIGMGQRAARHSEHLPIEILIAQRLLGFPLKVFLWGQAGQFTGGDHGQGASGEVVSLF